MAHSPSPFYVLPPASAAAFRCHAIALACLGAICLPVQAQTDPTEPAVITLPAIRAKLPPPPPPTAVSGFGNKPLASLPMQVTVISRNQLDQINASQLSDVIKLEASTSDAYNAYGYYDYLTIRGFVTDPRFNFRREGLPISAETPISLVNKERVELLKGTSGIQAGTSAPGGLINLVVKRPTVEPLRALTVFTGERGSLGTELDWSDRTGVDREIGYRVNLARHSHKPEVDGYDRLERSLAAFAGEWRLSSVSLVEAELEWSRQVGASLPGYSLTGDRLPDVRRPANLNNQPWSQPNEFDALTGTLRFDQALSGGWHWISQAGTQRLKTNDRVAFPFGFNCGAPTGSCDRYGPNGEFDLYDFRSENERRRVHSAQTVLQGAWQTGAIKHELRGGLAVSRLRYAVQQQTSFLVGTGNIDGRPVPAGNPQPTDAATNQVERTVEVFATDAIDWGQGWTTWLGLRHSRIDRESVRTDGTSPSDLSEPVTTPWLAGSYEWRPAHFVYASWGQGAELDVVPNRPLLYPATAGQPLPVLKSRQWEIGAKGSADNTDWAIAYFDIVRPKVTDAPPDYTADGTAHHRGLDGSINHRMNHWNVRVGAMLLDAQREGASNPAINGKRPTNVPKRSLKLQTGYQVQGLPGLYLMAGLTHEGRRTVLEDESIELPSWTRTDIGAILGHKLGSTALTWKLTVDNLFDRRAWKESPNQYGHVYLFPLDARTIRLALRADF